MPNQKKPLARLIYKIRTEGGNDQKAIKNDKAISD